MASAVLGRWGKSLAVRFPAEIAESAGLNEGQTIEIVERGDEVVIRRAAPSVIASMFAGKSPEEWRHLYRGIDPWGADVGREIVED